MSWLIQNAHVIDPASGLQAVCDVRLNQGLIAEIGQKLERGANTQCLDAAGLTLAPGLIDTRSFQTDAPACLAGGITSLCLMPDQRMALDDPALIEHARRLGGTYLRVFPFIAATRGLQGQEMAELGLCQAAGGIAAASGRTQIANDLVAYRIAQYAQGLRLPMVAHAEVLSLTQECVATEGEFATRMGLAASPVFAESMAIARDLRLVEATGVALHIPQVTTAEGLGLIRQAKARGLPVTCGVTPAHFLLNEVSVSTWRTYARLSPPLRSERDRLAVVAALQDGTIDVISSGHDPRTAEEKRLPFAQAQPGMVGAQTLLALALSLVHAGGLNLPALLACLTANPARIFGLPLGRITPGSPADLVLFDFEAPWRILADDLLSSAKNTPFDGHPVMGRVCYTFAQGQLAYSLS